jgi:hypothetical protein
MVGLGRFELPTYGLGNLFPMLTGYESFILYYILQSVTNSMISGCVLVLTRFEQRTTTVLLQQAPASFPHVSKPHPSRGVLHRVHGHNGHSCNFGESDAR